MQKRERWLATIAGVLLLLAAGQFLYGTVQAAFDERHARLNDFEKEAGDKQAMIARGQRARGRLKEWQRRSLPSDLELARSLYQNWLVGLVDQASFARARVNSSPVVTKRGVYYRLPFTVSGQGTLEQVTRFLYDFYKADHLHQVWRLNLKPIESGEAARKPAELDVLLSIEALVLPGADRRSELASAPADRLAWGKLEDYLKPIVERNVFAPFSPAPPAVAQSDPTAAAAQPPDFDTAKHAFVTAVLDVGGKPQVWLNVRTTGELLKLDEGDEFQVGTFRGTIERIGALAVEILADGRRQLVPLGKSLRDSQDVPPGGS